MPHGGNGGAWVLFGIFVPERMRAVPVYPIGVKPQGQACSRRKRYDLSTQTNKHTDEICTTDRQTYRQCCTRQHHIFCHTLLRQQRNPHEDSVLKFCVDHMRRRREVMTHAPQNNGSTVFILISGGGACVKPRTSTIV